MPQLLEKEIVEINGDTGGARNFIEFGQKNYRKTLLPSDE